VIALATLTALPTFLASPTEASTTPVSISRPRPARLSFRFDTRRFPQERAFVRTLHFPNLGEQYEVLAPRTPRYNCIAWSAGITNRWEWPAPNGRKATVRDFDQFYARFGYRRVRTLDYRVQPGVDKVVLYGHVRRGQPIEPTHAARQAPNGTWTSKLGKAPLIRHLTPDSVNGAGPNGYGRPVAVYVRVRGHGTVASR
jgi:type VI secretion system secreted protein VgrG